jgi:hypothetical protein
MDITARLLKRVFKDEPIVGMKVDPKMLFDLPEDIKEDVIPKCLEAGVVTQKDLDFVLGFYYTNWDMMTETQIIEQLDVYILTKTKWNGLLSLVQDVILSGRYVLAKEILIHEKVGRPGDIILLDTVTRTTTGDRQQALDLAKYCVEVLETPLYEEFYLHIDTCIYDVKKTAVRCLPLNDPVRQYIDSTTVIAVVVWCASLTAIPFFELFR